MASFSLDQAFETSSKDLKKCWKLSVAYLIHKFKNYYGKHQILLKASLTLSGQRTLKSLVYRVIAKGQPANIQRNRPICWESKRMRCNHILLSPGQFQLSLTDWGWAFNQAAAQRRICVPLTVKHRAQPVRNFRNPVYPKSSKCIRARPLYTHLNYKITNSSVFYDNILH